MSISVLGGRIGLGALCGGGCEGKRHCDFGEERGIGFPWSGIRDGGGSFRGGGGDVDLLY